MHDDKNLLADREQNDSQSDRKSDNQIDRNNGQNQPKDRYDVIIAGGGPAGLMAAIAAGQPGVKVLLVDKGNRLGRKLSISGGGRCNVTNNKELDELIRHIPGNGRFLYSALSHFNNKHIIAFFEGLGIRLKEEDNGRMFPATDKAKTVVDALISQVRKQGVHIRTNCPVDHVIYEHGAVAGIKLKNGERIDGQAVIIATGGKSVPQTGSTGDGFVWAREAGHTITELFPTEVPITLTDAFIQSRELQGLSLRDVTLTVWKPKGNKPLISHTGDMIFTHFGISGPIALRCSQFIHKVKKQHGLREVLLTIDLFPEQSGEELFQSIYKEIKDQPKKMIKNILRNIVPERLLPVLLRKSNLNGDITGDHASKPSISDFVQVLKAFRLHADGTLSLEQAFVTGGGVHIKEIDPKTMQSRLMPGLFFCGEVLDVHGYTGGYNITAAFVTGHTAGRHAALLAETIYSDASNAGIENIIPTTSRRGVPSSESASDSEQPL